MTIIKTASLPDIIRAVVNDKVTEKPFTGEHENFDQRGTYLCRQCGLALFRSNSKFISGCGWPSFDEEVKGAILQELDADGKRIEILCARCRAHLGHVFVGEYFTNKNIRYCVNSLSLDFVTSETILDTEETIFAAGCFWGVEYLFKKLPGVLKTEVGYTGGHTKDPTYETVCKNLTGHYEAVRVVYDPQKISYEEVVKYFFEIHDPTQIYGQGADQGEQYRSAIFYYHTEQNNIASQIMNQLEKMGYHLATQLLPVRTFWQAECYHQNYYDNNRKQPYCHQYTKRFL